MYQLVGYSINHSSFTHAHPFTPLFPQEWNCTEDCEKVGNGNYLAINDTCIDVFYYKENGSIYANVTWSCAHGKLSEIIKTMALKQ